MRTYEVKIRGITPYSQSKYIIPELLEGEEKDDHDARRWREHMHVDDRGYVAIPATGLMDAIQAGAKLDGEKIKGRGNKTWGALFVGGIAMYEDARTNVLASTVKCEGFMCDAKGQKGDKSTTRVLRRFPMIPAWEASFSIDVLDDSIPSDRVRAAIANAGMRVGVGRFRPSKGGTNGRFAIVSFEQAVAAEAAE